MSKINDGFSIQVIDLGLHRATDASVMSIVVLESNPGTQGTAPDRIASYIRKEREAFLLVEIDEGTMTIEPSQRVIDSPSFWNQSSLLRKWVVYTNAYRAKAHIEIYDIPVFRVLTVTTSTQRAENMAAACGKYLNGAPPGLFLFTSWEDLADLERNVYDLPLLDGRGKSVRLVKD